MSKILICLSTTALMIFFDSSRLLADGGTIIVQARTNATPGIQFDSIETRFFTGDRSRLIDTVTHNVDVRRDYEETVRVADWQLPGGFDDGVYSVTVALRRAGEKVVERSAQVWSCCHSHGGSHHPPGPELITFFLAVNDVDEDKLVALHNWYSRSRADNFSTTDWRAGPGTTHSPDYAWVELMGYSYLTPAPGRRPLYHWYSPDRGDNLTTTDPNWHGRAGDTRDGYGFAGVIAFVLSEPAAGTIPLYSWYSPSRGDNYLSSAWVGRPGDIRSPDYRFVREEGYLLLATVATPFVRGDSDASGGLEVTDAIRILSFLFIGTPAKIDCQDSADADDSGVLDLTDGVYLLQYSFLGGPRPPEPFEKCGEDPTPDDLDCESFFACDSARMREN